MREPRIRDRRKRPSRRGLVARVLLVVLLLVLAFLVGVAFARTLDEQVEPGGVVTNVRTLTPLPQKPPARTVTVTVTSP
ncbi:MAG: hypothetical protein H0T97_09795 [Actinobacteria bacterium]|nr:hypothetical protein [Actinomycetota bacterium]